MSRTYRRESGSYKKRNISDNSNNKGLIGFFHAPAWFRREKNSEYRAKVKDALNKNREVPIHKSDADWDWW